MTAESSLAYRAAEAMREAAAKAAAGGASDLRRAGDDKEAQRCEFIAARIRRLDLDAVLAEALQRAPRAGEIAAFEAAAQASLFGIQRGRSGGYLHPITGRVRQVWNAALRWAREGQSK
jgi:hypothetical protein